MQIARVFRIQNKVAVLALALLAFCPTLRAQKLGGEVWAGYSNLRFDTTTLGFSDHSYLNGWNIGLSLPDLYEGFGVAADVSGHYASRKASGSMATDCLAKHEPGCVSREAQNWNHQI